MSFRKIIRKSQPQSAVRIDWSNPLARGLRIAVTPNNNVNLADSTALSQASDWVATSTNNGLASLTGYLQWPEPSDAMSDGAQFDVSVFTVLCFGRQSSPQNSSDTFARGQGSSTINGWSIGFHGGSNNGAYAKACGVEIAPTSTHADLSKPTVAILTAESSGLVLYCNGTVQGTASYTTPTYQYSPGTTRRAVFGSKTAAGNTTSNQLFLGLFWTRVLTPAEIVSISENPWQLFKSVSQPIFVPAAFPVSYKIITARKTRTNQPQSVINLNPRFNPVSAFLPPNTADMVRGVPIIRQSNTVFSAIDKENIVRGTSTTTNTKISFGSNGLSDYVGTTGPVTFVTRFKLNTLGINQFIMCSMDSSGYNGISIFIDSSNSLILSWRDQSGGMVRQITFGTVNTTDWYNVVLTTDPSWGIYGYVNGVALTPNTITDVARRATGRVAYLGPGEYPADFWNSNASIALGAVLRLDARVSGASLSLNPWQLFAPRQVPVFVTEVVISVFRPDSDLVVNGWSAVPSGALYATINEELADDANYASSPDLLTPVTMGLNYPMPIGSYLVKVRVKSNASGQVRIILLDDSNAIVGTSSWQTATGSFTTYTLSVTTTAIATKFKIEVQ